MKFVYATGGREKYFKATNVGDCVTRAIANATGVDYKEVYDRLFALTKSRKPSKRERHYAHETPRNGVFTRVAKKYIEEELGWVWVPCMGIGTGCKVHVADGELPSHGNLILNLSRHFSCVKDGVLYDTYDCSRDGSRCVYGYWRAPTPAERKAWLVRRSMALTEASEKQAAREDLAKRKAAAKKHNDKIKKSYAKKIRELERRIKKLEAERDAKLIVVK